MRRFFLALGMLALGSVAFAQTGPDLPDLSQAAAGFGFRLGAYFPADSKLRDIRTTWVDAGLEYALENSLMKNGTTYLAGDWVSKTILGGTHAASLTINQRFYTGSSRLAAGGAPYFFLGVGGIWTDVEGNTGSSFVVRGGVGSEFSGGFFVEAAGTLSAKVHGVNPSGIGVSLGFRFK